MKIAALLLEFPSIPHGFCSALWTYTFCVEKLITLFAPSSFPVFPFLFFPAKTTSARCVGRRLARTTSLNRRRYAFTISHWPCCVVFLFLILSVVSLCFCSSFCLCVYALRPISLFLCVFRLRIHYCFPSLVSSRTARLAGRRFVPLSLVAFVRLYASLYWPVAIMLSLYCSSPISVFSCPLLC